MVGREPLGANRGDPTLDQVFRESSLGRSRNIRRGGDALRRRDAEGTDISGLDLALQGGQGADAPIDLASDDVLQHGAEATVGNMGREGAGHLLEHLGRQMQDGAVAGRGVVVLAGIGL